MKNQRHKLLVIVFSLIALFAPLNGFAADKPALVLLIVIDQFRSDYLSRFKTRFLPTRDSRGKLGGFNYLINAGAYYPFMECDILQCMTAAGHATLLSGSYPYRMGIVTNSWFDENLQEEMYCVKDKKSAVVGVNSNGEGYSPKNMIGDTVGDQLKNAGFTSRVVSIALKDRAAVLLGGHRADLSLWFDSSSFKWISSQYYLPAGKLPDWVSRMNSEIEKQKGTYYEWNAQSGGAGFGHKAIIGTKDVLNYPYGLELTALAAEKAIDSYKLGRGKATDLLSISFSSHDSLGHLYGPNSKEMEELTVYEDKVIAKLLAMVNRKVNGGLKNTLVVLTADHGVAPSTSWLQSLGLQAGIINNAEVADKIENQLNGKFGRSTTGKWLASVNDFNYFINAAAIKEKQVSRSIVELETKNSLLSVPGIAHVFTRGEYEQRKLPPGEIGRLVLNTYYPGRSGDVVAIPKPYFIHDEDNVSHLTAYSYDRVVPFIAAGPGIKPGIYSRQVKSIDIAPTLSFLLGVVPPSLSEGRVLSEIISLTNKK